MTFSILGGSSVGGGSAYFWNQIAEALFQYPRRIECGWWPFFPFSHPRHARLSVSSADRVWVVAFCGWPSSSYSTSFSILGGSSVGGGHWIARVISNALGLSVSSADRVWVVAPGAGGGLPGRPAFSILGGSSVGGGTVGVMPTKKSQNFQYPRRIECGWWLSSTAARDRMAAFQYPRRIECGWWWRAWSGAPGRL